MNIVSTQIPEVIILEPHVFEDNRGYFFESFNERALADKAGINVRFVQDNHSRSVNRVLRGLHYQIQQPQGKLVRVLVGAVLDVAVDIRRSSLTFGQWVSCLITAENKRQFWVPPGFAHGFLVISETAEVLYKTTDYYAPQYDRCIRWNDPDLAIDWQLAETPILSQKDQVGKRFHEAEVFA